MGARRLRWLGIIPLAAGLSFCLWVGCLNRVPDAVTYQIKEGMTKDEVRAVAGEPSHTENGGTLWAYWIFEHGPTAPLSPVYVSFDADERVTAVWN
jgi:outer membrane protein assembly factor BamE (lipoprotein component of BamABCDE complex)